MINFVCGECFLRTRDTPLNVPPVPYPDTQKSNPISLKSFNISIAVVSSCISALAVFSNCRA